MISTLEQTFDLEEDTKAIILRKRINPKSGDQLKVYIPRVMRGIERGEPKVKISPVQYRGAFANAPECKPQISPLLREQNYLIGLYQNNSGSKSVVKVVYNEDEDIAKTYIPEEKEVRCTFVNGKLKQLRLNTNNNMTYDANEFIYDTYVLKANAAEEDEDSDEDLIEEVKYDDDGDEDEESTAGAKKSYMKRVGNNEVEVERKAPIGTKIRL